MEAEDAALHMHAAEASDAAGAHVDITEPESSPFPSTPAEPRSASEGTPQSTAPKIADDESSTAHHSLLADTNPSEAVLSAQSEESMQADISEILLPSPSMALLHSRRPESDADSPQTDLQLEQPVSRVQEPEPAEHEIANTAQVSSTEAQPNTSDGSPVTEQLSPAEHAPSALGQQEGDIAAFVHATFVVPTENWKHMQMVPLATTAAEIKHSLCSNWNIAESALSVKYNKQELQDAQSLASCGIQASPRSFSSCLWFLCKSSPGMHFCASMSEAEYSYSFSISIAEW